MKGQLFTDERSRYVNDMFVRELGRPATPQEIGRYRKLGTFALQGIIDTIKITKVDETNEQSLINAANNADKQPGVSLVGPYNTQCGISTYTENLHAALKTLGFRCHVLAGREKNRHGSEESEENVFRCWDRADSNSSFSMAEKAMQMENRVVHVCSHEYGIYDNEFFKRTIRLLKLCGFKVPVTLHTVLDQKTLDWVYDAADVLIVHSEWAAHRLYGAGINNVTVIQHGTEKPLDVTREESIAFLKSMINIEPGDVIASSPGFISMNKALENSLQAVVASGIPHLKYLVVGSTARRVGDSEYINKLKEYESDNIKVVQRFLTKREMAMIMTASDFCIFNYEPTHHSTSGMSHLAMTYGVPTVSSTSKILYDLGSSMSIKVPHDNIRAMADAIVTLAGDEVMRNSMAQAALIEGEKTYWENVAKSHVSVYKALMEKK